MYSHKSILRIYIYIYVFIFFPGKKKNNALGPKICWRHVPVPESTPWWMKTKKPTRKWRPPNIVLWWHLGPWSVESSETSMNQWAFINRCPPPSEWWRKSMDFSMSVLGTQPNQRMIPRQPLGYVHVHGDSSMHQGWLLRSIEFWNGWQARVIHVINFCKCLSGCVKVWYIHLLQL